MHANRSKLQIVLGALVLTGLAGTSTMAQTTVYTFDTSSSPGRFDYGGPHDSGAVSWSSIDKAGSPSSGSALLAGTINQTTDGTSDGYVAFTFDTTYPATSFYDLSFDIMIGAGSATDSFGGYGDFGVATRLTDSYNYDSVYDSELGAYGLAVTP